jgi:hypothetical protein
MKTLLIIFTLIMVGCILEPEAIKSEDNVETDQIILGEWRDVKYSQFIWVNTYSVGNELSDTITGRLLLDGDVRSYEYNRFSDTLEILFTDSYSIKFIR